MIFFKPTGDSGNQYKKYYKLFQKIEKMANIKLNHIFKY